MRYNDVEGLYLKEPDVNKYPSLRLKVSDAKSSLRAH